MFILLYLFQHSYFSYLSDKNIVPAVWETGADYDSGDKWRKQLTYRQGERCIHTQNRHQGDKHDETEMDRKRDECQQVCGKEINLQKRVQTRINSHWAANKGNTNAWGEMNEDQLHISGGPEAPLITERRVWSRGMWRRGWRRGSCGDGWGWGDDAIRQGGAGREAESRQPAGPEALHLVDLLKAWPEAPSTRPDLSLLCPDSAFSWLVDPRAL